ncbi:MAG: MATE family efflux transporter [Fibrobacter sp.]|nr:MATE family efflux transporter [Fibrobacter sp.]
MSEALKNTKLNAMGTASIGRLILQFSVPSIISMCVEALYNIVDRYFVGQGVGFMGIGGITICFPIVLFISAMSMIIGVGSNTLFAIRLGEKKYSQASIIMNHGFMLLIVMAVLAFVLGETFMNPLLRLFGASDELLPYASTYMRIILCGALFQTITPGMNHFIRSMGHPKTAMFRVMIGAGTNVILDYIFIMKFGWGISGAAWATVISQLIGSIFVMQFFLKKDTPIKFNWRHMKLKFVYVRKIFILGLPPSVMQICGSLMNAILAWSLTTYGNVSLFKGEIIGGDMAISAFGILNSIATVILFPVIGFVHGMQPIIGYNFGAKQFNRVRRAVRVAMSYAAGFVLTAWVILQWNCEFFISPFAAGDVRLLEISSWGLRIFMGAMFMIPFGMVAGNFFQGTGKAGRSLFLNACRQVILFIPFLILMPHLMEPTAELRGVFIAQPIADTGAAVIGMIMLIREMRKMPRQ